MPQAFGLAAQPGQNGRTSQILCVDAGVTLTVVAAMGMIAATPRSWTARSRQACLRA